MKQLLVFILFAAMMCWFMFAPIYKHVLIVRQAVLQKEVDLLLEIGANGSHGYIDNGMINASRARLESRGFQPGMLIYSVTTTDGSTGANPLQPVIRGVGIGLQITYPFERLFEIDRLIGIEPPPENGRLSAYGLKMSEYVP